MAEKKKATGTTKKPATEGKASKAKTTKASAAPEAPKKSTAKTAAPKSSTPRTKKAKPGNGAISEEMRQHMIREAAYYRAEHRGFSGAADMEDWLVAEQEIDAMLGRLRA